MSNLIFWFSGSGNSKYVADRLSAGLSSFVGDIRQIAISEALKEGDLHYVTEGKSSVGLVFPTFFWGVPTIVREFIEKVNFSGSASGIFFYAVLTCGGSTGTADKMAARLMGRRGYELNHSFSVSMPDDYCILLDLMTPKDQIAPILEAAEVRIERLIEVIGSIMGGNPIEYCREELIDRGSSPRVKSSLMYPLYLYGRSTSPFYAEESCIGCGKCAQVCPMGMIEMREGRPHWKEGRCTQCLSCLHHCPVEAVQYGKRTKGRLRYLLSRYKPNICF